MIALNFIFWCVVIGALAAFAIPFIILFLIGAKRRSPLIKWLGGVPAAFILIGAFSFFCLLIYGFAHPWSETTNPQDIRTSFKSNFGFEPGTDFVPLNQKIYCLADFGCMHLKFKASTVTFERIVASDFRKISASEFASSTGGKNAPNWWIKPDELKDDCFENSEWKGSFSTNRAYIFYDRTLGLVYFYSEGID